ncbi:hypothetical protein AVEN_57162-1 [Araneus ventricosus]|uniref:Uncharacterized protein n=1 Tax=Araneus ventricosus TaxID=182803 RepID=A0A4Y2HFU2_ARAVE|nr:hypothetical protein AVEN_57162-1 [Araneus ventricosus]
MPYRLLCDKKVVSAIAGSGDEMKLVTQLVYSSPSANSPFGYNAPRLAAMMSCTTSCIRTNNFLIVPIRMEKAFASVYHAKSQKFDSKPADLRWSILSSC